MKCNVPKCSVTFASQSHQRKHIAVLNRVVFYPSFTPPTGKREPGSVRPLRHSHSEPESWLKPLSADATVQVFNMRFQYPCWIDAVHIYCCVWECSQSTPGYDMPYCLFVLCRITCQACTMRNLKSEIVRQQPALHFSGPSCDWIWLESSHCDLSLIHKLDFCQHKTCVFLLAGADNDMSST